jgi:uridine kinase
MKGDVINAEEHHYKAALGIVDRLLPGIRDVSGRYTMTVAGESGSGKSETARAIAETLEEKAGIRCVVLQQDDYFIYPPKTNDATRRRDISWVGSGEVRLDLLDAHLQAALGGRSEIHKPLVIYDEDRIVEETVDLENVKVVIAEGTYTTLLKNVHARVFIARNRLETMESRKKRGREAMDPFIEEVLKIEHEIISKHRTLADIVITRDYDREFITI